MEEWSATGRKQIEYSTGQIWFRRLRDTNVRNHATSKAGIGNPIGQKQRMFPWKEEREARCRGNCLSEPLLPLCYPRPHPLTFLSFIRYSGERRCEVLKNGFDSAPPALQTFRIHEQRKKRRRFSRLPLVLVRLVSLFHILSISFSLVTLCPPNARQQF